MVYCTAKKSKSCKIVNIILHNAHKENKKATYTHYIKTKKYIDKNILKDTSNEDRLN